MINISIKQWWFVKQPGTTEMHPALSLLLLFSVLYWERSQNPGWKKVSVLCLLWSPLLPQHCSMKSRWVPLVWCTWGQPKKSTFLGLQWHWFINSRGWKLVFIVWSNSSVSSSPKCWFSLLDTERGTDPKFLDWGLPDVEWHREPNSSFSLNRALDSKMCMGKRQAGDVDA